MAGRAGYPGMHQQGHNAGVIVEGSADRFGALVLATGKTFVKKHPVISLSWVLGLLISMLATGFTPTPEAVQQYEWKMARLNYDGLAEAEDEMVYWQGIYQRSRGMFWGCDDSCKRNKRKFEASRRAFDIINKDYQKELSEAKSELGVFSEDGVSEAKDLFWRKVAGGKQFAKRATMWDAMFIGVGSLTSRRDEGLLAVVIKLVFRVLINLTMGLFMAVLEFVFSVWRVIWSYQPDPISTLAFFCMAALAAVSLLATWLLGLAAIGVTGVYAVAKAAETAQIEAARQGQQPQYVQHHRQQQQTYQSRDQHARHRRPPPYAPGSHPSSSAQDTTGSNWEHID